MNRKGRKPVAAPVLELQRDLEESRRSQPRRAKLPAYGPKIGSA